MSLTATCYECGNEISLVGDPQRYALHDDGDRTCPGSYGIADAGDEAWIESLESRFTAPSDWCPHPERWHSPDNDSAEQEVASFVASLVRVLRPGLVVETGTAWGNTARLIGAILDGTDGWLHTFEPDPVRAAHCREELRDLPVTVHEQKSLDWAPLDQIDFCWFDSLLELRIPEFHHLYDHMAPGSYVAFHDTSPWFGPRLRREIERLETEGYLLPVFFRTPRGLCIGEVVK